MDKSKMKSIRKQVRRADLANKKESHGKLGGNLEDVHMKDSTLEERIYERNTDTGEIKSRKKMDYGNERIEEVGTIIRNQAKDMSNQNEWLDELWGLDKKLVDGKWYISLSDVVKITLGEYGDE